MADFSPSTTFDVVTFARGIEHLDDVAHALRERIEDMAAALRIYHGDAEADDFSRLELASDVDADPADEIVSWADTFALEVKVARWDDQRDVPEPAGVARVRFLLAYGGPNVWLDISYHGEDPDRVTLERFWGGDRDRAECEDGRALRIVDSFVRAFFVVE